jgi:hypothetical protein
VSPPSSSALCGYPHRCVAIPSTTTPSPSLWEPGTTRHRHPRHCTPSGLPSATPSSRRTDGDSSGKHPRSHPRSRFWASIGLATTPAGSEIRRDDQQLHSIVHHTAICRLELCGTIVNRLPLGLEKEESVPWPRGGGGEDVLLHTRIFPPSPRYWHSASIKPQGPGGLSSSPATLVAPHTTVQRNTATRAPPCWTYGTRPEPG